MEKVSKLKLVWGLVLAGGELVIQYLTKLYGWGKANTYLGWGLPCSLGWCGQSEVWFKLIVLGVFGGVVLGFRKVWLKNWGWWLVIVGGGANSVARLVWGEVWDYLSLFGWWLNGADLLISLGVVIYLADIFDFQA